jgi:hypothetical protein
MPISAVNTTTGTQNTATSATTASVTLTVGKRYTMWVGISRAAETVANPTVSGWTRAVSYENYGGGNRRVALFTKDGDGSTGTHVIDCAGSTQDLIKWSMDEWTDWSGTIVQSKTGAGETLTMTSNIASASNAIALGMYTNSGSENITPEAGFTVLGRRQADGSGGIMTMYRVDADAAPPTPSYTMQFGGASHAVAVELQASGGGGSAIARISSGYHTRNINR